MSMTSSRLSAPERREQLLGVALRVFAQRGFHNSSMNDVADAAGVTKPVLYQHFESKRALYVAALEAVGEDMISAIRRATEDAASGREKTTAGMVAYFKWVMEDPDAFMLLFGSGTRRDEEFAAVSMRIEKTTAEMIAPLIDADVDIEQQRIIAHALIGMSEGASRHLIQSGEKFDPKSVGEQLATLAWAGLRSIGRKPA
jgi:AcrR family transcriptional regulator